jgi:hypothetical protein
LALAKHAKQISSMAGTFSGMADLIAIKEVGRPTLPGKAGGSILH